MDPATVWLYFHSAVFQGDMALLAFVGVFVVFKLQQISSDLQSQFKNIDTFVRQFMSHRGSPIPVSFHDIPSLKAEIDRMAQSDNVKEKANEIIRDPRYPSSLQVYDWTERGRKNIIRRFWWPVGFLSAAILGSLVALPLYNTFASYYRTIIGAFILLNISAFAVNVFYVRYVVGQTGATAEQLAQPNQIDA